MYGVKNIIMYVIRKLPGWRGSYQMWKLVQPLLSWQHGTYWVMLLIFQWSRGGGKIFHYLPVCPRDSTLFLAILTLTDSIYTCFTCKCVFSKTHHSQKWHFKKDTDNKGLRKLAMTIWSPVSEKSISLQKTNMEDHLSTSASKSYSNIESLQCYWNVTGNCIHLHWQIFSVRANEVLWLM